MKGADQRPESLREHIARGGLAVAREPGAKGGDILFYEDDETHFVMQATEIPAAERLAEFNAADALAATAMALVQEL